MATTPAITSGLTGSNSNVNISPTAIRTSLLDSTNPSYPRIWQLSAGYLTLSHGTYSAAIELSAAIPALLALVPQLTWPPIITVSPSNVANVPINNSSSFAITATSEIAISYQWQGSNGSGYSNLSNAGVYSNVTTNTLNISNCAGLNGFLFQCLAINNSGQTNSTPASLTTDPAILTQPSNVTVAHPAPASFSVLGFGTTSLTYRWQDNSGGGFSNLSDSGVYSNTATNNMAISNSTGLNGYLFRCQVIDSAGTAISNSATLTVS